MIGVTLALVFGIFVLLYIFLVWNYDYWSKRGVPGPKPQIIVGNFSSSISQKRHITYDVDDIYREFKAKADFVGIYNMRMPQLLPLNHNLVHRIFVDDFKHFHDNEFSTMVTEKSDYFLGNNPFNVVGEKWKTKRMDLIPGLTVNRIKNSFPVSQKVAKCFVDYLREEMKLKLENGINVKEASLKYTCELATEAILGLEARTFTENPTPIFETAKKLFYGETYIFVIYPLISGLLPIIRKFYKITFIPKPIERFFMDLMASAVKFRKTNPTNQADFMNYMLQLEEKKKFSVPEMASLSMVVFTDAFETTATALTHLLLMLARYEDHQNILRDEILAELGQEGEIDFDKMSELPYLDACLHESLRIFPPGFFLSKLCTKTIEWVNKDGSVFKIPEGQSVVLPVFSIMRDEDLYPEPQIFKPERFLPQNGGVKKYRDMGAFYAFGDGPRVCMGMRFALTQLKTAIVQILRTFDVKLNPKTRSDNRLDPKYFLARLDGDVWLEFIERKKTN